MKYLSWHHKSISHYSLWGRQTVPQEAEMDRYHRSTGHSRPARRHARRRGGRGQSLVEFALAVPLFLALLTGSLEMGMLFKSHSAYQEATQEAVRAGSAVGATDQDALDELKTILSAENLNNIQSVTVFDATVSDTVPTVPDTYTNYVYDRTFNGSGGFVCPVAPDSSPLTAVDRAVAMVVVIS